MPDSSNNRHDDGFLSRWSRLKSQPAEAGESAAADAQRTAEQVQSLSSTIDQVSGSSPQQAVVVDADSALRQLDDELSVADNEPLTDADMPDIDTLDEQSDFSGFLSEKVSEHLRRKALQKLFHLPEFNIRDGLNEYDEDYSKFIPLGDTVTYQMKQFIERQKQEFNDALESDDSDRSVKAFTEVSQATGDGGDSAVRSNPEGMAEQAAKIDLDDDDLGDCE